MLGEPNPTSMKLLMVDRTEKKSIGIFYDVLVKLVSFIIPSNYMFFDYNVDFKVHLVLGRSFLAMEREFVDMEMGQIKFKLTDKQVTFNVRQFMQYSKDI